MKQAGVVHNTKPQQNNENCYILAVLKYYAIKIAQKGYNNFNCSDLV